MNVSSDKKTLSQLHTEGQALVEQAEGMLEKLLIRNIHLSQQVKQLTTELETELARRNPPEPLA